MDITLQILLGLIVALILHELTHLLVIFYYRIPLKAIVLTKWTAFGFLVDNEHYATDDKKLILLHFLPLIWCLVIFIDPSKPYLLMFPLVNIFGGFGDMYYYLRIVLLPSQERVAWLNRSDERVLKSIVWKKEF